MQMSERARQLMFRLTSNTRRELRNRKISRRSGELGLHGSARFERLGTVSVGFLLGSRLRCQQTIAARGINLRLSRRPSRPGRQHQAAHRTGGGYP